MAPPGGGRVRRVRRRRPRSTLAVRCRPRGSRIRESFRGGYTYTQLKAGGVLTPSSVVVHGPDHGGAGAGEADRDTRRKLGRSVNENRFGRNRPGGGKGCPRASDRPTTRTRTVDEACTASVSPRSARTRENGVGLWRRATGGRGTLYGGNRSNRQFHEDVQRSGVGGSTWPRVGRRAKGRETGFPRDAIAARGARRLVTSRRFSGRWTGRRRQGDAARLSGAVSGSSRVFADDRPTATRYSKHAGADVSCRAIFVLTRRNVVLWSVEWDSYSTRQVYVATLLAYDSTTIPDDFTWSTSKRQIRRGRSIETISDTLLKFLLKTDFTCLLNFYLGTSFFLLDIRLGIRY